MIWLAPDRADGQESQPPAAAEVAAPDPGCEPFAGREACRSVAVDAVTVRYSIAYPPQWGDDGEGRPESRVPAGAVLYDVGGPGASVLSGDFGLAGARNDVWGDARGVLITLEEPWVTAEVAPDCKASAESYYRAARDGDVGGVRGHADEVAEDCAAWFGFTPDLYARAVLQILEDNNFTLTGFVGHSFASVRYAYLVSWGVDVPWAVVTRPFPYGAGLDELNAERASVLAGADRVDKVLRNETAEQVDGRSVPVAPFDYWSAAVELDQLADDELDSALSGIAGTDSAAFAGGLSDELWGRYGVDSLSPGMLAQWQEVCRAGGSPGKAPAASGVEFVLWSLVATCDRADQSFTAPDTGQSAAGWKQAWEIAQHRLCVTSSDTDSVTPGSLIHKYFSHANIIEVPAASHASTEGFDACMAYFDAVEAEPVGEYGAPLSPDGPGG
ncbi:hypothetical protein [Promicromonospora aerolata]|uniref:Alpha/beta hydrolase family protein n=1 Tax=Promicromonospora aerolata TaxID=195749 RepID=A0ABW4V5X3_9MICO